MLTKVQSDIQKIADLTKQQLAKYYADFQSDKDGLDCTPEELLEDLASTVVAEFTDIMDVYLGDD